MKLKLMTAGFMVVGLLILVACSPQTAEVPVDQDAQGEASQIETAAEQPTVAQVAEEPAAPTAVPTDTPQPTDTPVPAVEEEAPEAEEVVEEAPEEPEAEVVVADAPVQFGRTEEGAFYYGSPTASIKLIDHSDFL